MENHYFDNTHPLRPYTHSAYATPGTSAPANALRKELLPERDGFHFGEKSGDWTYIEDHRGKNGFVNGESLVIEEYGSLPEGWSDTPPAPPAPTAEELSERLRNITASRLAETDMYGMADYPDNEKRAAFRAYRAELRELNHQEGAPWDGGGDETPWPVIPQL